MPRWSDQFDHAADEMTQVGQWGASIPRPAIARGERSLDPRTRADVTDDCGRSDVAPPIIE